MKIRRHRGAVLVLVLVMLALLAMLAISLATTSVLERAVSHNYIDEVRARLVAKAGIEHAISRIQSMVQRGRFDDPSMTYWGLKTTEAGDPDEDTPLSKALNPSYAIEAEAEQNPDDEKTEPARFKLDDREVGISGTMSASAYGLQSDVYRLRVSDANSRINVNDGLDDPHVTKNLRRILNHLGDACKVANVGGRLIDARPRVGYRTRTEIKHLLGAPDYSKVGHHITAYSWTDKDLVNPVPLSTATLSAYPVNYNEKISIYRYGRSRSVTGNIIEEPLAFAPDFAPHDSFRHAVMALDELNAQWISRTSRSPVNVNAATVEVLTALISDLRGFYMTERRKRNLAGNVYSFMFHHQFNGVPGGDGTPNHPVGGELGYLFATQPFAGPGDEGGTVATGSGPRIKAKTIAEEIVACRSGRKSTQVGEFDYGSVWYGGPFRTWRQFNAFCDGLVARGILFDSRAIYSDYSIQKMPGEEYLFDQNTGSDVLVPSLTQPKVGAQALADVLKANFNPNCTLNELNPDRNLYLDVDKTDLICNSTEFCFTPMGIFEIESEGVIVKTPGHKEDFLKSKVGVIQARETIECIVKVYEVYRESTQASFSKGDLGLRVRRLMTNSNRPLELGPEPQAAENPEECKWSGWIQLSTIGGIRRPEEKNAVMTTPKGSPELGAAAYGHYQFDHRLNYHASDQPHPLQFSGGSGNQPDRTETHAGPYNPARGGRGEYRLARDWSQLDVPPNADYKAVSDLRIDGAYIERDGSILYPCTLDVFSTVGTVAFWLKPSFRPEMTGKPRTFFSTDTHAPGGGMSQNMPRWQLVNGLWFFPSHRTPPYQVVDQEHDPANYYQGPWRPTALVGGFATPDEGRGAPYFQPIGGAVGHFSPSLNHETHKSCTIPKDVKDRGDVNLMRHHQWMHVAYCWDMSADQVYIMVNGLTFHTTPPDFEVHPFPTKAEEWTKENAIFRLGEPSTTLTLDSNRNWTVDGTIDEFYLWKGKTIETVGTLYDRGRYHVPRFGQEGLFTSQSIISERVLGQKLPGPTSLRPPYVPRAEGGQNRTQTANDSAPAGGSDVLRPICAFWTWYGHDVDEKGVAYVEDGYDDETPLPIEVTFRLLLDGDEVGEWLKDDGGSAIENVSVRRGQKLQYRIKVFMPTTEGGTILKTSPMIDDVTLFYSEELKYIHYNRVETDP